MAHILSFKFDKSLSEVEQQLNDFNYGAVQFEFFGKLS